MELRFPSGRTARELVIRDAAQLLWIANLGCVDLNPHPVRADDLEHPDELRIDLDPGPGVEWDDVRRVAMVVRDVLEEHALVGWPKTSGSRGMHVNVRIERRWSFDEVRRAALALAREVERRAPERATSKWWKEERHGVFIDYNQNARTAPWLRRGRCGRPPMLASRCPPLEEVPEVDPSAFTLVTPPRDSSSAVIWRPGASTAPWDRSQACSSSPPRRSRQVSVTHRGLRIAASRQASPRVAPSRAKGARKQLKAEGDGAKSGGRRQSNIL